jgi:hydrogenase maturation protease
MITVIGCGNANRSDDGAGPAVVRALRQRGTAYPDVKLLDAGTDGMAVMFAARGSCTLIVVDACRSGAAPGAIFAVPGSVLEQDYRPALNLHDFRWNHALAAGRRMFGREFPRDLTVFLIEAENLGLGVALSQAATAAVETVTGDIVALIAARRAEAAAA